MKVDVKPGAGGLVTSDAEDLRVGVDGGDAGCWILRFEEQRERAGAAAEIENAVVWLEIGLLNEPGFKGAFANGGLDDEVVPRSECAKAERGDVGGRHAG